MTASLARPALPRIRELTRAAKAPAVSVFVVVAAWYVIAAALGPARVPSPSAVVATLVQDRHLLGNNLAATAQTAVIGFLIGNGIAVACGIAVAALPRAVRRPSTTVIVVFYNLPVIAVAPLLQVLLPGAGPRIATAALSVFFPTLLGTLSGLRASDPAALDLARSVGASPARTLLRVRLRYAAPDVLSGLAVAVPFALIGAMVGEFLGGVDQGMGVLLVAAMQQLNAARVWAIALIIAVLGGAGMAAATAASRALFPYGATRSASGTENAGLARRIGPLRGVVTTMVTVLVLLGLWLAVVRGLDLPRFLARTPADVWQYLFAGPEAVAHRNTLLAALGVTIARALLGAAIGLAVGFAIALAVERFRALRAGLLPLVLALNSVPYLALVPILAVAIGRGPQTTMTLAAVTGLLPTVTMVRSGLQNTPAAYGDVAHASGGRLGYRLLLITLPSLTPALFVSLRQVIPLALYAVLVGEFLATGDGIGGRLVSDAVNGSYDSAWSGCILVTIASACLYLVAEQAERIALAHVAPERI